MNRPQKERQKKSKSKKWFTRIGIGCGIIFLLSVIGVSISTFFMLEPFREGITAREALENQFGTQSDYVPAPDGRIAEQRLEVFLAVRERLMTQCAEFERVFNEFDQLDELENDSKTGAFRQMMKAARSAMRMGPLTGTFFKERNTALLEAGMGFGEYTYIYVIAYREHLGVARKVPSSDSTGERPRSRIIQVYEHILLNQLQAIHDTRVLESDPDSSYTRLENQVHAEISKLKGQTKRTLWQDGPPPSVLESFEPYRSRLDRLFCDRTRDYELIRNEKKGPGVHGD